MEVNVINNQISVSNDQKKEDKKVHPLLLILLMMEGSVDKANNRLSNLIDMSSDQKDILQRLDNEIKDLQAELKKEVDKANPNQQKIEELRVTVHEKEMEISKAQSNASAFWQVQLSSAWQAMQSETQMGANVNKLFIQETLPQMGIKG